MQLSFEKQNSGDYTAKLVGEFDAQGCREVRKDLEAVVDKCGNNLLALDMTDVSFIDSSGVGAIVFLFKRIKAGGGDLALVNVHSQPHELLTLLRVNEAITVNPLASGTAHSLA